MDEQQLKQAQTAATQAVALGHGTMFQGIAERLQGEVSHELNTTRTLAELEKQFSQPHN